jgi:uncharacterized protein YciI
MPHVIITHDKPDHAHLRKAHQLEHRRYLDAHCQKLLLAAGAMFDETGAVAKGSVLLLDTDERSVAEEFVRNDPFTKAGLFASITIAPWRKAFFNFETLVPLG